MSDVFGRNVVYGGSMTAEATRVGISGVNEGLIVQQMEIQYQQQISRLYALESGKIYFVAGQTEGRARMQHVVGPTGLAVGFYAAAGNVCSPQNLTVSMGSGCTGPVGGGSVSLNNSVLSGVSFQASAENMIIFGGAEAMFVSLTVG